MGQTSFGPFVFDDADNTLRREGKAVALGGRAGALLSALIGADGRVVAKDALIEAGWPGLVVEDGNLTVQMAGLRRALGAKQDGSEWIVTVPRVGYRLIATVPTKTKIEAPASLPALAVMPFQNLSGDAEQDYFADGVVEDMTTALSRFRSFAVIARNSSFVFKGRAVDVRQVAAALGAQYALEGSVRRAGQRLRITAQLVEGGTGANLWANSFDGSVDDVFDFQDRITEAVVGVIEPAIQKAEVARSRRERPESMDAYDLYLRGLQGMFGAGAEINEIGLGFLNQSIALAPRFAAAMAAAAWCIEHRVSMGWPDVRGSEPERGLSLARQAIALGGDDAVVLGHSGRVLQVIGREYDHGLLVIKRAVGANPNSVTALLCAGIGHLQGGDLGEALGYFHRVIKLSPDQGFAAMTGVAHVKLCLGEHEEGIEWAHRSQAENARYEATHWMLIAAHAHLGRLDEAKRALAAYLDIAPGATLSRIARGQHTKDASRTDVLIEGMRLAGMPEA